MKTKRSKRLSAQEADSSSQRRCRTSFLPSSSCAGTRIPTRDPASCGSAIVWTACVKAKTRWMCPGRAICGGHRGSAQGRHATRAERNRATPHPLDGPHLRHQQRRRNRGFSLGCVASACLAPGATEVTVGSAGRARGPQPATWRRPHCLRGP